MSLMRIWKKGNLEDIISLIDQGCNKNKILYETCIFGHIQVLKYLVEKCGVDVKGEYNYAIRNASSKGHIEIVKYLIEKCGVDARVINNSAVRGASRGGYLEIVKYLVEECGANARVINDCAVRGACENGHVEVVKYLVEKCGVDVSGGNDYAIQWASVHCHFEVVKYLVEKCGAVLPVLSEFNPKYQRYIYVCEKGENRKRYLMAKKIYFWWVQMCYNPNSLCGQRSMYKGYREYLNIH